MGPYCRYCDHRCFVERKVSDTYFEDYKTIQSYAPPVDTILLATCTMGRANDQDHGFYLYGFCTANAGGSTPGCDNPAGNDGLCNDHRIAYRKMGV